VASEEIAQPQELPDLFDIAERLCFFDRLQFVRARKDPLLSKAEPEISGFIGRKYTFLQVDPEIVGRQPSKDCIKSCQVLLVVL